jgi:hypothetical protein
MAREELSDDGMKGISKKEGVVEERTAAGYYPLGIFGVRIYDRLGVSERRGQC